MSNIGIIQPNGARVGNYLRSININEPQTRVNQLDSEELDVLAHEIRDYSNRVKKQSHCLPVIIAWMPT